MLAARDTRLWHPFADMRAVRGQEVVIVRGDGVWVWDDAGRRYLDGTASLWCVNVGHGRREIVDAVHDQMSTLASYHTFGAFANEPARRLAARLCALAPLDDPRVFLTSGGGDSIDTAAKLARAFFTLTGAPERTHLISRRFGYHGTHGMGTSLGGIAPNRAGIGPLDPSTSLVDWQSLEALSAEFERVGPERVAAVFVEPVMGAGGLRLPPPGYLDGVAALCASTGALFVLDAVIVGFGRLGTWFGVERFGLRPDLLTFAKGVTSGYLPLGGVVASGRVAEPFWERGAWFRHGPTYAGHPTCCAAALANLDLLERDGLLERACTLEAELEQALRELADHPLVGDIRAGVGFLGAVGLDPAFLAEDPAAPARVTAAARERGVLVRQLGDAVAVSPPLIATRADVELAVDALGEALDSVAVHA